VRLRWLAIPAGIVFGLIAETGWPAGSDIRLVAADLTVGWLLLGGGFLIWRSRPANRMGMLVVATGAAWFLATYHPPAVFLYMGPLVHVLLANPTGRLVGWPRRLIASSVYVVTALAAVMALAWAGPS
jgi:hypothetical protein